MRDVTGKEVLITDYYDYWQAVNVNKIIRHASLSVVKSWGVQRRLSSIMNDRLWPIAWCSLIVSEPIRRPTSSRLDYYQADIVPFDLRISLYFMFFGKCCWLYLYYWRVRSFSWECLCSPSQFELSKPETVTLPFRLHWDNCTHTRTHTRTHTTPSVVVQCCQGFSWLAGSYYNLQ